jgi:hypothetical protein
LAAAVLGADILLGAARKSAESPGLPAPTPPPGALDPSSTAIRLEGSALAAYLRLPPLEIGHPAPLLEGEDHRGEAFRSPAPGKPTVWMSLCGCEDCRSAGHAVWWIHKELAEPPQCLYFVRNNSGYIWGRMTSSFGGRVRVVRDEDLAHYRRLRAPGGAQSLLPLVWGIDGAGKVRFFGRPEAGETAWVDELIRQLGLRRRGAPPP